MNAKEIRDSLRKGENKSLSRRRKIALLSAIGLVDFSIISLYQMGFIKRLPDIPGKIFDSNKVNASPHAYGMGLPDGPVSSGLYSLIMMLASYKGDKKSGRPFWADLALAGAITANAVGAVQYTKNMISQQEKACPYCITGALINFAMVPFVAADIKDKFKKLINQK
jgi:uncharacterized membrane protein